MLRCWIVIGLCVLAGCDQDTMDGADDGAGAGSAASASPTTSATSGSGSTDGAPDQSGVTTDSTGEDEDEPGNEDPGSTGSGESGPAETEGGSGGEGPSVEACLAMVDAVEFDNTPPQGETRVPGLGECVDQLDGEALWNYHCQWCHSALDNNDIDERTIERIWWAVDLSESVGNWPAGGLRDHPDAVDLILEAVLASSPPVPTHPHPLPEYN